MGAHWELTGSSLGALWELFGSSLQLRVYPKWYSRKSINNVEDILCYTKPGGNPANWKIVLPEDLIKSIFKWYHQVTGHPRSKRLYGQLGQRYYHRDLLWMVDNLNCDYCQRNKLDGKGYGFLPEREVQSIPFEECTVDLIGPWKVQVRRKPHKFEAFDVPVQDPKSRTRVKNPRQDPMPRSQTKNISHNCCLFVCLLLSQIPG